ncbi:hypothetical protein GQ53DRAFT_820271 [Thozetella sp. PMI_491]|nr:hypothetical protein GQ53DRAFT_820271 [Thozetella sp. PMI_491]
MDRDYSFHVEEPVEDADALWPDPPQDLARLLTTLNLNAISTTVTDLDPIWGEPNQQPDFPSDLFSDLFWLSAPSTSTGEGLLAPMKSVFSPKLLQTPAVPASNDFISIPQGFETTIESVESTVFPSTLGFECISDLRDMKLRCPGISSTARPPPAIPVDLSSNMPNDE